MMQLKELRITKLFGHFDHQIPLNTNEKITIITGPNGYGKTMILDLIHGIFKGDFEFVRRVYFEQLTLVFDNEYLVIRQIDDRTLHIALMAGEPDGMTKPTVKHETTMSFAKELTDRDIVDGGLRVGIIEQVAPFLKRVDRDLWYDTTIDKELSLGEVMKLYPFLAQHLGMKTPKRADWLQAFIGELNVHIIKDQRLLQRTRIIRDRPDRGRGSPIDTIDTIEQYAKELKETLAKCKLAYDTKARELDASLPKRWFASQSETAKFTPAQLGQRIETLKATYQRLNKYGVLTSNDPFAQNNPLDPAEDLKFLTFYVQDHAEKLEIYESVLSQIELFTDILNKKRLAFKEVRISPDEGFVFISDGKPLQLTQLSSGEQHQVVMLYELIFKAKDNDLILIDEPEISLHIAWQKAFLNDVKHIINMQNISVVIATHSPQIIDNHWDLTVDLEDGE